MRGSQRRWARAGSSRSPATVPRPRSGRSTSWSPIRHAGGVGRSRRALGRRPAAGAVSHARLAGARRSRSRCRPALRGAARRRQFAAQAMVAGALARARRRLAARGIAPVWSAGAGEARSSTRRSRWRYRVVRRHARPRAAVASARRAPLLVAPTPASRTSGASSVRRPSRCSAPVRRCSAAPATSGATRLPVGHDRPVPVPRPARAVQARHRLGTTLRSQRRPTAPSAHLCMPASASCHASDAGVTPAMRASSASSIFSIASLRCWL